MSEYNLAAMAQAASVRWGPLDNDGRHFRPEELPLPPKDNGSLTQKECIQALVGAHHYLHISPRREEQFQEACQKFQEVSKDYPSWGGPRDADGHMLAPAVASILGRAWDEQDKKYGKLKPAPMVHISATPYAPSPGGFLSSVMGSAEEMEKFRKAAVAALNKTEFPTAEIDGKPVRITGYSLDSSGEERIDYEMPEVWTNTDPIPGQP